MTKKIGLMVSEETFAAIDSLPVDMQQRFYNSMFRYAFGASIDDLPLRPEERLAFMFIKSTVDMDRERYDEALKKKKEAAYGRWSKNAQDANYADASHAVNDASALNHANDAQDANHANHALPTIHPTFEKKDSANALSKEKLRKVFRKPMPEEVQAYCDERRNGIQGQDFCDFYESKGWRIGTSPMKDWQAAVRTWEKRDRSGGAGGQPRAGPDDDEWHRQLAENMRKADELEAGYDEQQG